MIRKRTYQTQLICLLLLFQSITTAAQDLFFVQNGGVVSVQTNAQATVHGGVRLFNGSNLSNAGTITVRQIGAAGATNWTDATITPYFHGNGTVVFNGTGGHTATSRNRFGRIHINASGHVTLGSTITTDNLYLNNGRVNTTSSYRMTVLTTPELAVDASPSNTNYTNSWVNGTLRRYVTTGSVNNYWFPVGDVVKNNRALLTDVTANPLNNLSYIDARFGTKPGTDINLSVADFTQYAVAVSNGGVWFFDADVQPTAGNFDLLLYFNGFTDLTDNRFSIIRRPLASSDAAQWQVPAGSGIDTNNSTGRIVASGFARRYNVSLLGQYGLGIYSSPLPDADIILTARRINQQQVQLNWQLNNEQDIVFYDLERKLYNEPFFSKVYSVSSKQQNNLVTYQHTDANASQQQSWYRIKAIGKNGAAGYSPVRIVDGIAEVISRISIFPNPANSYFMIQAGEQFTGMEAKLYDGAGREVKRFQLNNLTFCDVSHLNSGVYIIAVPSKTNREDVFTKKIIVVH